MTKFIPKVGDKVAFPGGSGEVIVANEDVNGLIIICNSLGEYVRVAINVIKPIKTPAEIAREEEILMIADILFESESKNIMEEATAIYDAGYRKQQVKPLSWPHAFNEIEMGSFQYEKLGADGYIIRGGDK
jgi:hypothetical protein